MKMSKQEQKDEFKETEGHPAIKQRIRRLQRQSRRRRMLKDVERAAVVITNPTEYAIALEYRVDMDAPVVVAKGRNLIAAQIKKLPAGRGFRWSRTFPWPTRCTARSRSDNRFPAQLYTVVAEILAAIWRAQTRANQNQVHKISRHKIRPRKIRPRPPKTPAAARRRGHKPWPQPLRP